MLKKILIIVISIVLSVVILFLLFSGLYYIRAIKVKKASEEYARNFKSVTEKVITNVSEDSRKLVE